MVRAGVIGIYTITTFAIWIGSTIYDGRGNTRDGFLTKRQESHPIRRSAFLRDQNPAAIVVEVIPLAYSNLKWDGAVRTMVACISLEHGRRFPLKTNAPN